MLLSQVIGMTPGYNTPTTVACRGITFLALSPENLTDPDTVAGRSHSGRRTDLNALSRRISLANVQSTETCNK